MMSGINVSGVSCWAFNGTRQLETRTTFTLAFSFVSRNQALVAKGNINYTNSPRIRSGLFTVCIAYLPDLDLTIRKLVSRTVDPGAIHAFSRGGSWGSEQVAAALVWPPR
jgi:hypothetical protein